MISLDEAYSALTKLRDPNPMTAFEAKTTLLAYLEEAQVRALQKAFDLEPAPDGPPMPKGDL